jgi:hypothetical protein
MIQRSIAMKRVTSGAILSCIGMLLVLWPTLIARAYGPTFSGCVYDSTCTTNPPAGGENWCSAWHWSPDCDSTTETDCIGNDAAGFFCEEIEQSTPPPGCQYNVSINCGDSFWIQCEWDLPSNTCLPDISIWGDNNSPCSVWICSPIYHNSQPRLAPRPPSAD